MNPVVVIDDDEETLLATQLILQCEGYHVVAAPDYETGLALALAPASLVVTDLLLDSGRRGDALVREVVEQLGDDAPPFLIRTASNDLQAIAQALSCAAVSVIHKGTGPQSLVKAVRHALQAASAAA